MKVLILTDHTSHSAENSLYSLAVELLRHGAVAQVDIASRKSVENEDFFNADMYSSLWVTTIDEDLAYDRVHHPLDHDRQIADIAQYDFVWLRMPPPLSERFLKFLDRAFIDQVVINSPLSIYETGSKAFLLNFSDVCPPMQLCRSLEEIESASREFPIVLKPLREYGGKGIVKIDGDNVSSGTHKMTLQDFAVQYERQPITYLAVRYLKNVRQGDKRIIVIDGQVMGASLRLPAEQSWICNVAMGGSSHYTEVAPEEIEIIQSIDPMLSSNGVVMYGVDTLVGDDGKRVLSEINTTSIGGLPQIAQLTGEPIVRRGIDLIVKNVLNRMQ